MKTLRSLTGLICFLGFLSGSALANEWSPNQKNLFPEERSLNLAAEPEDSIRQLYAISMMNGREYIGYILSDDGRELLIETEALGKIYLTKSEIKSIAKVDGPKDLMHGEYAPEGPFTTRYAFSTNALPIKRGENYATINLYGPEVHFTLSDNFNIGLMTTWMASPLVAAIKYSVETGNKKINFSLGTLLGTSGYLNSFRGWGGLHFANVTFGDRVKNLTVSGGYLYVDPGIYRETYTTGSFVDPYDYTYYTASSERVPMTHGPMLGLAGIIKVGAKASIVFDGMFGLYYSERTNVKTSATSQTDIYGNPLYLHEITRDPTQAFAIVLMPGMRFQGKDRSAFQFSLAGISVFRLKGYGDLDGDNFSFPMPMCTWFFKF